MMIINTLKHLKMYNQIYKEADIVYHKYAKSCGLSDMGFWILYSMAESDEYFTQRSFCGEWFCAPQSVNSALKDLEKKDIIFLEAVSGNKKNKLIKPTENGKKFVEKHILPLIKAECKSFETLPEKECELMLCTQKKYVSELKENVIALKKELDRQN